MKSITPTFRVSSLSEAKAIHKALVVAGLDEAAAAFEKAAKSRYPGRQSNGIWCDSHKTTGNYVTWSVQPDFVGEYRWELRQQVRRPFLMTVIRETHTGYGRRKDAKAAALAAGKTL